MGGSLGRRIARNSPFTLAASAIHGTNFMNAVDTNVLVYLIDADEPRKHSKAIELVDRLVERDDDETVLLWQVAAEFLGCLCRREREGRIARQDMLRNLDWLDATFRCELPAQSVPRKSLELSSRYSLSHWDSMLIAACIEAGVHTFYSEDLSSGATYESVTVVNPFANES
jgi:predicted nucleic acid-binding protein